jgi:hypothetical protein
MQNWCLGNGVVLNVGKPMTISYIHKTIRIYWNYKLCNNLLLCSQCVKDLGVMLDYKLYFHHHTDYTFSEGLKMLGLIQYITSFLTRQPLGFAYQTCMAQIWVCICRLELLTLTDLSKLGRVQSKFADLATVDFFFFLDACGNNYEGILDRFNLSTLYSTWQHLDVLFLINVSKNRINCSVDSVRVCIPTRMTDYSTFTVNHNFKVTPSARYFLLLMLFARHWLSIFTQQIVKWKSSCT